MNFIVYLIAFYIHSTKVEKNGFRPNEIFKKVLVGIVAADNIWDGIYIQMMRHYITPRWTSVVRGAGFKPVAD